MVISLAIFNQMSQTLKISIDLTHICYLVEYENFSTFVARDMFTSKSQISRNSIFDVFEDYLSLAIFANF